MFSRSRKRLNRGHEALGNAKDGPPSTFTPEGVYEKKTKEALDFLRSRGVWITKESKNTFQYKWLPMLEGSEEETCVPCKATTWVGRGEMTVGTTLYLTVDIKRIILSKGKEKPLKAYCRSSLKRKENTGGGTCRLRSKGVRRSKSIEQRKKSKGGDRGPGVET